MGMARLLGAKPECPPAAWLDAAKVRGVGTTSFRCNITNHYFYCRFIAFVNCDISAIWRKLRLRRVPNHTWQNIEERGYS
jgi:hypothetical protein